MKSEHLEQVEFVAWMHRHHPGHPLFAIPNGGQRNAVAGARLKAEGAEPGVPDLLIPSLFLFIEMKREDGGTVDTEQEIWRQILEEAGYRHAFCLGCEEAQKAVEWFWNPPTANMLALAQKLQACKLKRIEAKRRRIQGRANG